MSPTRALRHLYPALRTSPSLRRTFSSSHALRDQSSKTESLPATFRRVTIVGASVGWIVAGLMYFYSPSTVHTAQGAKTREGFLRECFSSYFSRCVMFSFGVLLYEQRTFY